MHACAAHLCEVVVQPLRRPQPAHAVAPAGRRTAQHHGAIARVVALLHTRVVVVMVMVMVMMMVMVRVMIMVMIMVVVVVVVVVVLVVLVLVLVVVVMRSECS
jgi:hypothetical protein